MQNKEIAIAYLKELKAESVSTRKCLERIPESTYKFKPHPKSMQMGYLVLLVAEIPLWISSMIEIGEIDFATYKRVEPVNTKEMLDHFEDCLQKAMTSLETATDESLAGEFSLKSNGELLYSEKKLSAISSTINHWVHHRGQLSVYMRLNEIAVPSIYGPSADEQTFNPAS